MMKASLLGLLILISLSLFSQKDALKKANEFINEHDYRSALMQLNEIQNIESSAPLLFKRAKCYYEINNLNQAMAELSKVDAMGYKDNDALYYKGRVMHHKGNFKQAIKAYKAYLKMSSSGDIKRQETRDHIRHCGAALDILFIEPIATIENAGPNINSRYNDQRLVQSSGKNNRFYFTSNRSDKDQKVASYLSNSYSIDASADANIYYTEKKENDWTKAQKLEDRNVNTYKDDILIDLSLDGSSIYLRRGNEAKEIIAQSNSTELKRRVLALFDLIQDNEYLHFFNDSTVLFSSSRYDGFGGNDIYVTAYVNDKWLIPKNLGREINSSRDELSPYLTNDGSSLYFSSNRSFSVGGFDVFTSKFLFEQQIWTLPKNLGLPINSPGNETHFRISDDGLISTYTSDRKDGYGYQDLYFAYLNEKSEHQAFTVRDLSFIDYPDFYLKKIADHTNIPVLADNSVETVTIQNSKIPTAISVIPKQPSKIILPILFLNKDGQLMTDYNYDKLNRLADIIKNSPYPLDLEVMSFSHKEGIAEYNLFLSIKNAEKIKKALIDRGLTSNRIHLKGFGNFLPMIKSSVEDDDITQLNDRIEFKINLSGDGYIVENQVIDISKNYFNKGYDIYRTLIDDAISYKIQIATVRQMYRGTALKLYNDVQVEKDPKTGNYLYSIGLYDNFIEANLIMRELFDRGITALKIVPYVDGLRVEEQDLINYVNKYPEIKDYLRSMTYSEME